MLEIRTKLNYTHSPVCHDLTQTGEFEPDSRSLDVLTRH
jgi:hypothetical protein